MNIDLDIKAGVTDPLSENVFTIKGCLVHKYTNRVLLEITNRCAVKCDFCTRKWKLDEMDNDFGDENMVQALQYIGEHKEINEVIISGGDPLMVSDRLKIVLKRLEKIEHLEIIRIHTRLPVVAPNLFDISLFGFFEKYKKIIYLSLHFERFIEITNENIKLIKRLRSCGVILYSQSVFLKGINDNVLELENLFTGLLKIGIRPYLIYHCDKTKGTEKFWVEIEKERKIMSELKLKISGLACPSHVIDSYKGKGKILVPDCRWSCNMSSFKDFDGQEIINF